MNGLNLNNGTIEVTFPVTPFHGVYITGLETDNITLELHEGAEGPQGPEGPVGPKGDTGDTGDPGEGLPSGGAAGQVPVKSSSADFATAWQTPLVANKFTVGTTAPSSPAVNDVWIDTT
jgi:hypothetical protein